MKSFILFIFFCCTAARSKAQDLEKKISIQLSHSSIRDALDEVSRKSNLNIIYSNKIAPLTSPLTVSFDQADVRTILNKLLLPAHLTYTLSGNDVIIKELVRYNNRPVKGRVIDARTKEGLVGVTIRVKGGAGATATDNNGNFSISVPDGKPTLIFSYIGYVTQEVNASSLTNLTISLLQNSKILNEVVVQARRSVNTEIQVLKDRRNASVVSDAISAQQIEKTASITTTQALQRVTGVTITDDKYVAIRGLGERAVIAELNGIRLSSSNPDRSAAPLDLIPAALLDNVTVYKTLTPDRPADASAGIVELKTKSVPDSLTISFIAQTGYRSTVGLSGKFNSFYGADLGFFGQRVTDHDLSKEFLNLSNQYPGSNSRIAIQNVFIQARHDPATYAEAIRISNIMHRFDPILATSYQQAVPNQIYTVSFGNTFKILHGHEFGVIVTANYYRRTEDQYNGEANQYSLYQGIVTGSNNPVIFSNLQIPNSVTPDNIRLGKYLSYREDIGHETINYGVLTGLTYRFNKRNEINVQYVGSRGAESQGKNLNGNYSNTGFNYPVYSYVNLLSRQYRIFNTFNFQGEHKFFNKPWSPKLSYNAGFSKSNQDEPDTRATNVVDGHQLKFQDVNGNGYGTDFYSLVYGVANGITANGQPFYINPNGRYYRRLNEQNYNYKADLDAPFTFLGNVQELKIGFNYLKRSRKYGENLIDIPGTKANFTATGSIVYADNGALNQAGVNGDINQLVSTNRIALGDPAKYDVLGAPPVGGFIYQTLKSPNNYTGTYDTRALYAMADLRPTKYLRIIGGARFESTEIKALVDSNNVTNNPFRAGSLSIYASPPKPNTSYAQGYKPYFSVNAVVSVIRNMNFRLAFNTALARPELREITNIFEYDPFQFGIVIGNPKLVNQFNRNYDFRWEWFPSQGEVISFSGFHKQIYHQLTKTFSLTSQGSQSQVPETPVIQFINDPSEGKVYGFEFEIRKRVSQYIPLLDQFFVGANLLIANSVITKNAERYNGNQTIDRATSRFSPVFEQAPYAANVYLDYNNAKTKTNLTVSFNEVGERLVQVQLDGVPDLYDRPVPVLDLVFSQRFGKRFAFKGFAKNLTNPDYKTVYAIPRSDGKYRGQTYINRRYKRGLELSLGLTFDLF